MSPWSPRRRPVVRRGGARLVLGACLVLALASACGSDPDGPGPAASRAGQVTLVETQPQVVGQATVVAYNVRGEGDEGSAGISVAGPGTGTATDAAGRGPNGRVTVGDAFEIGDATWVVVSITPDDGDGSGQPGSLAGRVVIAPQ